MKDKLSGEIKVVSNISKHYWLHWWHCWSPTTAISFHAITLVSSYSNYLVHWYQESQALHHGRFFPLKHYITKLWFHLFLCVANKPLKLISKIRVAFVCVFLFNLSGEVSKSWWLTTAAKRERFREGERQIWENLKKIKNDYIIHL